MKTSILAALVATLVLAGCNRSTHSANTAANETSSNADYTAANNTSSTDSLNVNRTTSDLRNATNSAANAIGNAATNVATTARMTEWKLNASDIQADLNDNKEIVRTKENTPAAATGNSDKSVIESLVQGRLEADSDIAGLKLKASANRHGEVTLKGKAESAEQVGRAIALALDTEGVNKVTSKIKLDKDAKTNR